jgi:hypothetical protein
MRDMRAEGEPISVGRRDRRTAELRALRDALVVAAFFGAVLLINGTLAILLIVVAGDRVVGDRRGARGQRRSCNGPRGVADRSARGRLGMQLSVSSPFWQSGLGRWRST